MGREGGRRTTMGGRRVAMHLFKGSFWVVGGCAAISTTSHPAFGEVKARCGTSFYKNVLYPLVSMYDAEEAHKLSIWAVANGLEPVDRCADHELLKTKVFGLEFSNPLGLAAGCDKQAEAAKQFMAMGFGFVEVGSVTPQPQPGNEQPRCFRLDEDQGIINRYGFNSDGADAVLARLETLRAEGELPGVLLSIWARTRQQTPCQTMCPVSRNSRTSPTSLSSISPRQTRPGCVHCRASVSSPLS